MDENKEVIEQQETGTNVYQQGTIIAYEAGKLYLAALESGDKQAAKQYFEQWAAACDKLHAFDENSSACYKTEQEVQAKLEMNRLDNETKLKIAEQEEQLKRELAEQEQILQKAQFIADCITRSIGTGVDVTKTMMFYRADCARMAWETAGYIPDNSKTAKSMINHGNKIIKM